MIIGEVVRGMGEVVRGMGEVILIEGDGGCHGGVLRRGMVEGYVLIAGTDTDPDHNCGL